MSTRGQRAASKKDTASKFAELRALKASGKKRIDTYKHTDEDDIYEEVDEDGYRQVVRDRLDQNDFVVDDNGLGYADNGMDDWEQRGEYDSAEERENDRSRIRPKAKTGQKKGEVVQAHKISQYLNTTANIQPQPRSVSTVLSLKPNDLC